MKRARDVLGWLANQNLNEPMMLFIYLFHKTLLRKGKEKVVVAEISCLLEYNTYNNGWYAISSRHSLHANIQRFL